MRRTFLLLGCAVLASVVAFAQDTGSSSASSSQDQNTQTQTKTQSNSTQENTVRGCLSGSPGNYTITDHTGTQWQVTGDDATLRSSVGREVEVRMSQNQSSDVSNQGSTTTRTTHSVQASQVTALSSACNSDNSMGSPSASPSPSSMDTTPDNGTNPKRTPDTTEPASPRMMSMLQQQSMPGAAAQSQNSASPQSQTSTPPVTSQTPANQTSPNATSQVGSSPANNTGMTESEANHDAQAARQGELSTNPQTGNTTGRGVNNQGVNNPSTTNPNAVPTSPNTATPSSTQAQPNAADDRNKPLYERQATDIPWATHSGTDTGNTGTPPPPQ